ncbi:hypothetical protein [Pedobacter cryophilus]|uniref:DUF4382 domain-containing protein n=1 Tax=Pedobacter cryophilus TaxID=2571271 RepID=A0A4U1BV36_9SPHI|nr:hypothetical protein [Pedobacter cryophilus]TKB96205.1 hypothetical protein FA046_13535 [Pedobacter cryophilus]
MKTNKLMSLILMVFCLISCKKENETATLTIKVLDINNQLASGIFVDVFDNLLSLTPGFQKNKTSLNGELKFIVANNKNYQVYLVPAYEYKDLYIGNTGTFKSQLEIDANPIQIPNPKVGDTKYADINADGIVNKLDLVLNVKISNDVETIIKLKSN